MIAFHGKPELKQLLLDEIQWHRQQDKIVQRTYGTEFSNGDFRGCAIACSIHSLNRRLGKKWPTDKHQVYEDELGIPIALAYLEDKIFEGLSAGRALDFPLQFMEAIPVGADLSSVAWRMIVFVLRDCRENAFADGKAAIDTVISLHQRLIDGGSVSDEEWMSAAESARSAAESAAESAAWSAARSAARSAAESARSAAYERFAEHLLLSLKAAPVDNEALQKERGA